MYIVGLLHRWGLGELVTAFSSYELQERLLPAEQPSKSEAARPTPPTPALGEPAEPQQPADEEPKLKPSSSLGGSARELLNSDGRLRKP